MRGLLAALLAVLPAYAIAQAQASAIPDAGRFDLAKTRLAAFAGLKAEVEHVAAAPGGQPEVRVAFAKDGAERRLLALATALADTPSAPRAFEITYRLDLEGGQPSRLALLVFEMGGGVWCRVSQQPMAARAATTQRLSLKSLGQAAFSSDGSGKLEWDNVRQVWIGLVLDGPARGTVAISDARVSAEPYVPTSPLKITGSGPGEWSLAQDPSVRSRLTTPDEGPSGKACMKFEFHFPLQRHMYALPSVAVPGSDVEGYRALRFAYKATLPEGIKGLLISLWEQNGAQYEALPYPPPAEDWSTVTIPFDSFRLGAWSRDDSGQLELEQVTRIVIGVHGAASGERGDGAIWASDIEFVP